MVGLNGSWIMRAAWLVIVLLAVFGAKLPLSQFVVLTLLALLIATLVFVKFVAVELIRRREKNVVKPARFENESQNVGMAQCSSGIDEYCETMGNMTNTERSLDSPDDELRTSLEMSELSDQSPDDFCSTGQWEDWS